MSVFAAAYPGSAVRCEKFSAAFCTGCADPGSVYFDNENAFFPGFVPEILADPCTEMKWLPVSGSLHYVSGIFLVISWKYDHGCLLFQCETYDLAADLMAIMF